MIFFNGRYRDDCFVIWSGSRQRLNSFHLFLNSLGEDLKFTRKIATGSLCFLDLKISIVDYKLATTVYSKPTDSHLFGKIEIIYGLPSSKRSLTKESKTNI